MSDHNIHQLLIASWQTFYLVFISGFLAVFLGICLGLMLVITRRGGLSGNILINLLLGLLVNITRSIPFIIFMILLIPFTRWLIGTSIGTNAAIVSLTLAAIVFYARVAESCFLDIDSGLIDAAVAMGASNWQIIWKIYLPESLVGLIKGATLTIVGLIGYSAMAGAIGGGGLGELAYNLGYLRFEPSIMFSTVVLLVILVQLVQSVGDWFANNSNYPNGKMISIIGIVLFFILVLVNIIPNFIFNINYDNNNKNNSSNLYHKIIKVGIMAGKEGGAYLPAKQVALDKYKLKIKFVVFDNYSLPNRALANGEIQANIFQHLPYLKEDMGAHGYKLTAVAKTFNYPIGFYSSKIKNISDLPNSALIIIASDPSNGGRELLLLQKHGLIKLNPKVGLLATPADIIYNPKNLKFKQLEAAIIPHTLDDADLVAINTSFLESIGLNLADAVLKEGGDSPYANIIVVQTKNKGMPWVKQLIGAVRSAPVVKAQQEMFPNGAVVPAID